MRQLLHKYGKKDIVYCAFIGTGDFGSVTVAQQTDWFKIVIAADIDLNAARESLLKAGITQDRLCYCDNAPDAQKAIEQGKFIYTDNPLMIMDVPIIDVVCEATGVPESGAVHCKTAIEKGKHVVVINKEVDSAIGPILKKMADEKGVVYTPADGDQHGLLINLVEWAKTMGFSVIAGGKARDVEFILDERERTISVNWEGITGKKWEVAHIAKEDMKYFEKIPQGKTKEYVGKRIELLSDLPNVEAFDLCELTIMSNYTGLKPMAQETSKGILRISEVPIAYCMEQNGGMYDKEGIIDSFTCLRRADEAGMGGGVYIVVRCDNAFAHKRLVCNGNIVNYDRSAALLFRPYHLCGLEIASSALYAAQLGVGATVAQYRPVVDMIKIAAHDIKAGETFGNDHDDKLRTIMVEPVKYGKNAPVPGHLLDGNTAKIDIKKGEIITYSMVNEPKNSVLWDLRKKQEGYFNAG